MKFEYKVIGFRAEVSQKDLDSGKAGEKVSGQLESLFEDYANDGWELHGQYAFNVEVKKGCLQSLISMGSPSPTVVIEQLVFRKAV